MNVAAIHTALVVATVTSRDTSVEISAPFFRAMKKPTATTNELDEVTIRYCLLSPIMNLDLGSG